MTASNAGIGDPYWYEWSVGLLYILDMLNPDNGIEAVTLQEKSITGWDDVLVHYKYGYKHFYQVKHTRAEDTITFGSLVHKEENKESLLAYLAKKWKEIDYHDNNRFILYSNKKIGDRPYTKSGESQRPPLCDFFSELKIQISNTDSLDSLKLSQEYLQALQSDWFPQFKEFSEIEIIKFLRQFEIQGGKEDLTKLESKLISNITRAFSISDSQAHSILQSLHSALSQWATSRWEKPSIKPEHVYEALSVSGNEFVGDHNVPAPNPFFESRLEIIHTIEQEIQNTENKVIFLCGNPGIGKTSIISKITISSNPLIHVRYYSFKPISPENDLLPADSGRTVKLRSLWNDLLSQLRILFKGKLAEYNVPIRNDFISDVEILREHVIRLAAEYSKIIGNRFVICIDGIDHAARADLPTEENFLNSLIPPDQLPAEIVFLIAGQPPESYTKYPSWIRNPHPKVKRIDIPELNVTDIKTLCQHWGAPPEIADRVYDYTNGNTLSVLYAIETIKNNNQLDDALQQLLDYGLKDGLSEYYKRIWNHALREYPSPYIKTSLAMIFSLTSSRLKPDYFLEIFSDYGLSFEAWSTVLQTLSPLIIKEDSGYRILHNDIKVFLNKIATSEELENYQRVASRLCDFYLVHDEFKLQKHFDLSRLLIKANRSQDVLDILNSEFIVEAYVLKAPKEEVDSLIEMALKVSLGKKDLTELHKVSCSIKSLAQLEARIQSEESWDYKDLRLPYMYEYRVIPFHEWNPASLSTVLGQIYDVLSEGIQIDRGANFWNNWFDGRSFNEIVDSLGEYRVDQLLATKDLSDNLTLLGRIALWLPINNFPKIEYPSQDSEKRGRIIAFFNKGILKEAADIQQYVYWKKAFNIFNGSFFHDDLRLTLLELLKQKQWRILTIFLNQFSKSKDLFSGNWVNLAYFGALLTKSEKLITLWHISDSEIIQNLKNQHSNDFQIKEFFISLAAFLIGWKQPYKDKSSVISDISNKVFSNHDSRTEIPIRVLIGYSFQIGQWVHESLNQNNADSVYVTNSTFVQILNGLLDFQKLAGAIHVSYYRNAEEFLFQMIHCHIGKANESFQQCLIDIYLNLYNERHPYSSRFKTAWIFLYNQGNEKECEILLERVAGKKGIIWEGDSEENLVIYNELKAMVRGTPFSEKIESSYIRMRWHRIGYLSHKDYSMSNIYVWLNDILEKHPKRWQKEGIKLLSLSQEIKDVGDNRYQRDIESLCMSAALRSSPEDACALYAIIDSNHFDPRNPDIIVSAIEKYTDLLTLDSSLSKLVWLTYTGSIYWMKFDGENSEIKVKSTIEIKFKDSVSSFLKETAPVIYNKELISPTTHDDNSNMTNREYICIGLDNFLNRDEEYFYLLKIELSNFFKDNNRLNIDLQNKVLDYIFRTLKHRFDWHSSTSISTFEILLPYLNKENQWRILEDLVSSFYTSNDYKSYFSLSNSIDSFCRILSKHSTSSLIQGFNRLSEIHTKWLYGFEKNDFTNKYIKILISDKSVNTWSKAALWLMVRKLDTRSALQIESALRATFHLLINFQDTVPYIDEIWNELSIDQQEYILFLLEAVIPNYKHDTATLRSLLKKATTSPVLSLRMQAYLAIKLIKNNDEFSIPHFQSTTLSKCGNLQPGISRVLDTHGQSNYINIDTQVLNSLFNRTKYVFPSLDNEFFESKLMFFYNEKASTFTCKEARKLREDSVLNSRNASDIFDEFLDHELCLSKEGTEINDLVSYAILNIDDPFVILNDYKPYPGIEKWEFTEDNKLNTKEKLIEIINDFLPENVVCVGGELRYFENDFMHILRCNSHIFDYIGDTPKTMNSRSAFWRSNIDPDDNNGWLFTEGYGTSKVHFLNNWIQPTKLLFDFSEWQFCQKTRSCFLENGKKVLWLERIIAPINYRTKYYQTSALQRWVCTKEALNDLSRYYDYEIEKKYNYEKKEWKF